MNRLENAMKRLLASTGNLFIGGHSADASRGRSLTPKEKMARKRRNKMARLSRRRNR